MDRIQRETGKDSVASVKWAATMVCRSGAAASKPGQKKRRLFSEPLGDIETKGKLRLKRRNKSSKAIYFLRYSQKKSPKKVVIGVADRIADVRNKPGVQDLLKIERRGLARNVWNAMKGKVHAGAGRRAGRGMGKTVYDNARVKSKLQPTDPEILLNNRLTYLENAYPGITQNAVVNGSKALERELDRRLRKTWGLA